MRAEQGFSGNAAFFRGDQQCRFRGVTGGRPCALFRAAAAVAGLLFLRAVDLCGAAKAAAGEQFPQCRLGERIDVAAVQLNGTGFLQTSPRDRKAFAAGNNGSDSHAVLGDRSGLVGADHAGTAQRFHTVQPVHQCPVLHHAADCQSKGNGDGGRQPLRNGSNGNGNAGHEHVKNRLAPQHAGKEHGSAYAKAQQSHDFSQSGKAFLKRCHFLPDLLQHGGDLSHLGACAGGNDHCFGTAPQNCRAGVDDVVLMQVVSGVGRVACLFGNCFGFAGENGLIHRQPRRLYQCTVRRNIVAGFQPHQVTADQFPCRNGLPLAVPTRRGGGSRQIAERFQRLLGAVFLQKAQNRVEQDNEDNGDRIGDLPQKCRNACGCQQNQYHHISELPEKHV